MSKERSSGDRQLNACCTTDFQSVSSVFRGRRDGCPSYDDGWQKTHRVVTERRRPPGNPATQARHFATGRRQFKDRPCAQKSSLTVVSVKTCGQSHAGDTVSARLLRRKCVSFRDSSWRGGLTVKGDEARRGCRVGLFGPPKASKNSPFPVSPTKSSQPIVLHSRDVPRVSIPEVFPLRPPSSQTDCLRNCILRTGFDSGHPSGNTGVFFFVPPVWRANASRPLRNPQCPPRRIPARHHLSPQCRIGERLGRSCGWSRFAPCFSRPVSPTTTRHPTPIAGRHAPVIARSRRPPGTGDSRERDAAASRGWRFLPQRFPLWGCAALIAVGAWSLGSLFLRLTRFEQPPGTLEREVLAAGAGLSAWSLFVLATGLAGGLSQAGYLAVLIGAVWRTSCSVGARGVVAASEVLARETRQGVTRICPGLKPLEAGECQPVIRSAAPSPPPSRFLEKSESSVGRRGVEAPRGTSGPPTVRGPNDVRGNVWDRRFSFGSWSHWLAADACRFSC